MPSAGLFKQQFLPLFLSAVACLFLVGLLYIEVIILNRFTTIDVIPEIRFVDVFIGLTVYLKTSVDFAIFIGNLMHTNPGWKNRISIELGTAFGNGLGTMAILLLWTAFKDIEWLLAIMVLFAALVLFKLAEEGLEHAKQTDREYPLLFRKSVQVLEIFLDRTNKFIAPILNHIIPNITMKAPPLAGFWALFGFAFFIPFILGLDDFAGYIPLFSITNVFGFSVGVFIAHAILNILLYLSPKRTIRIIKNPVIALVGSLAFVGLALYGVVEVVHILAP
jgi:hypothetical protein